MTNLTENLTSKQRILMEWLSLPKSERHPHTQELFAGSLGISEKTLRRWKKELDLDTLAAEHAKSTVARYVPDAIGALGREAAKGNIAHIKLVLELAQLYTEEVNVNVNHERQQIIEELSEFEERRRAQLQREANDGPAPEVVAENGKA